MSTPHRSPRRPGLLGSALAALVTVVAVCAGDAVARVFPYGPRHRSINDLGNQFVPFHAHLWDLLHGRAAGGLLLNWQSGYGTSFLPDFGTYLASPFAVLVGLFPRQDIDLAVYVVTVLKTAAAAAAMARLLRTQRRGPAWAAGLLGASYALCGWSVIEASYNPMWLDGLIAFPLLCLTGEWALRSRRPVAAVVVVALCWTANFYTAYMATLGAVLVLLVRLLLTREGARDRLRGLARAALTTVLGIALSMPVLLPLFLSSKQAYPGWFKPFVPVPAEDLLARLLPATYSFSSPALFIGTGALLLAAALPFHRAVAGRERLVWTGLVLLVLLSFQWMPTHLAWHLFATPNGSPYRQTFVLAGIVVMAAWAGLTSAGPPGTRALAGGAVALTAVLLAASGSPLATAWGLALFGGGLALAGAAWWAVRYGGRGGGGAGRGDGGRGSAERVGEERGSAEHVGEERGSEERGSEEHLGAEHVGAGHGSEERGSEERGSEERGSEERGGRGDGDVGHGDVGHGDRGRGDRGHGGGRPYGPGRGSRRLVLPALGAVALVLVLVAQAAATTAHGQRGKLAGLDDYPVWGAAHTARAGALEAAGGWPAYRTDAGRPALTGNDPMLLGGEGGAYYSSHTPDLFTRTMVALGAGWTSRGRNVQSLDNPVTDAVFSVGARLRPDGTVARAEVPPLVTVRPPGPEPVYGPSPFANQELLLGARVYEAPVSPGVCRAGTEAFLWALEYNGTARLADGPPFRLNANPPRNRAALQPMGVSRGPASALVFDQAAPARWQLSCLDRPRLTAAVAALRASAAGSVRVGSAGIRAELPPGSTGTAVLAAPAIAGWTCNGRPAAAHLGLVAAPLDGHTTRLTCTFRPPGLVPGLAVAGAALLALLTLSSGRAARRRRRL